MSTRKFNNTDKGLGVIIAIWVAIILVDLAFLGVVIWGIIELVQWVTTK